MRKALKIIGLVLLFFAIGFAIRVLTFDNPLRNARSIAQTYEEELHDEAVQLLGDARASGTKKQEIPHNSQPLHMKLLKPKRVEVSPEEGTVNVELRGGFAHQGFVLVADPASLSTQSLPTGRRQLSQHIWEYSD